MSNPLQCICTHPLGKSLCRITPASKLLAFVVMVSLPFVGAWVGYEYGVVTNTFHTMPIRTDSTQPNKVTPATWYEESTNRLESMAATTTFRGFFRENEKTAWGNTELCKQLYVQHDYPQNMWHQYYTQKILFGNTVQQFGEYGLLVNLPWSEIPEADRRMLEQATNTAISVTLHKKPAAGRGASACESFFSYVGVETDN